MSEMKTEEKPQAPATAPAPKKWNPNTDIRETPGKTRSGQRIARGGSGCADFKTAPKIDREKRRDGGSCADYKAKGR